MPRAATYLRVADDLRLRIAAGDWSAGQRLPGRGELGAHYGVGTGVVQKAQELLIIEGILEGRAGSGTFVRAPRRRMRIVRTVGNLADDAAAFQHDTAAAGLTGTWESQSDARVPAPADVAQRLRIPENAETVRTRYRFFADGQPVQLLCSWEPMALTGDSPILLPEAGPLAGAGILARMRSIALEISRTAETPRPARATQEEANLLGIPLGELVTRIERTHLTAADLPVETADITVPDNRADITYEIPTRRP